jgi:Ser/Thr protein kinase RdoA (MazF antagonist)
MDLQEKQFKAICSKLHAEYKSHSLLGRGAFNINYLLVTTKGNFVLRIGNSSHIENLVKEFEILKFLEGEFGPKVYFLDQSLTIIPKIYFIEEYLEGQHPGPIFPDDLVFAMGELYSRLHSYTSPNLPDYNNELEYYSLIKAYQWRTSAFFENREILDDELRTKLETYFEQAYKIVKENDRLFSKRKEFALNQGDPSRNNIFYRKKKVKLVDWEFTKFDLREWDLAFFIWSRELSGDKKKLFLYAADYPDSRLAIRQLEMIYLLHCLMMLSWMVERVHQVMKNEIDPLQMSSTKEEMNESIKESLVLLEKSLLIVKELF